MSLDDILKMTQVLFYLAIGSTAVLTYRSAKRGLLNAVNTEYQKRVMDRLAEVSADLVEHFDWESPKHLIHESASDEVFDRIVEKWLPHKDELIKDPEQMADSGVLLPRPQMTIELNKTVERISSDPFIPNILKEHLVHFYKSKADIMNSVFSKVFIEFEESLTESSSWANLEKLRSRTYTQIILGLRAAGFEPRHFDEQAHRIRQEIQEYLNQFDSLTKKR